MIIGTYNGANIIAFPSDLGDSDISAPESIEWDEYNVVSSSLNPFTGEEDIFDWMAGWWTANLSFASMDRHSADYWSAFISQCRGQANVFSVGNPKAALPKGSGAQVTAAQVTAGTLPANAPVVNGAGQTGFVLNVRGLAANSVNNYLPGDLLQVGLRAYKVLEPVNANSSGASSVTIWPQLRADAVSDGQGIVTSSPRGLFRLAKNNGNKYSVTSTSLNGMAGLSIREAL